MEIIINRQCNHNKTELIDTIYDFGPGTHIESLCVYCCKDCGSMFKYRHQYDPGCGSDSFIVYPGETERDISFTEEEWLNYFKILNNDKE